MRGYEIVLIINELDIFIFTYEKDQDFIFVGDVGMLLRHSEGLACQPFSKLARLGGFGRCQSVGRRQRFQTFFFGIGRSL